jgi:RHS repeat-associated protein
LTNLEYIGDSDEDDILNASFEYDGNGIRRKAVEGDVVTRYYHDGLNVLFEKDASGFTKKAYTRALDFPGGIGGLISMKRYETEEDDDEQEDNDPKVSYYHYDALGSVRGLSNEQGKLSAEFDYDAFGNGKNNKKWNTYRLSSKEFEDHAGLYYFGARYYDPETGRWLTPDPLGFIDGTNKYLYVANNPLNFIDPWGLDYVDVNVTGTPTGTISGALIGALLSGGNPMGITVGAILGSLGGTGGLMVDTETNELYLYLGAAIIPSIGPTGGISATYSSSTPISGMNIAGSSVVFGGAAQLGYTFGENGGLFTEYGFGIPRGVSFSSFSVFGPLRVPEFMQDYIQSLIQVQNKERK